MPKHGDRRPSKTYPGVDEVWEYIVSGAWIPVGYKYCSHAGRYVPNDQVKSHYLRRPWFDEEVNALVMEYGYYQASGTLRLVSEHNGSYFVPIPSTGYKYDGTKGCLYKDGQIFYKEYGGYYEPGHKYSFYWKKWFKEDEEIPRIPWAWSDCGLALHPFLTCCGAKILYGFGGALYEDERTALAAGRPACWPGGYDEAFERELLPYRGRATGMILAILNLNQQPVFEATLLKHGFKLLSKHANLNHGPEHWNYLYGFGCLENAVAVTEGASMFGGAAPPEPVELIDPDFDDEDDNDNDYWGDQDDEF